MDREYKIKSREKVIAYTRYNLYQPITAEMRKMLKEDRIIVADPTLIISKVKHLAVMKGGKEDYPKGPTHPSDPAA